MLRLGTFSITAHCPRTGMLGMAVSTAVPAAGPICVFVRNGVGAVATQSWVNPYLGIDGLKLLADGVSASDVIARLVRDDPGHEVRQLGITDMQGRTAAYTGKACVEWAGHIVGSGFTVQGNMLTGEATIQAMAQSAEECRDLDLPERLMQALEAGQAAGGDKRGKQSAALCVYYKEEFPYIDVRADDHGTPVAELRRIFEVVKRQLLPFVKGMPTRADPLGDVPDAVAQMLGKPPAERAN